MEATDKKYTVAEKQALDVFQRHVAAFTAGRLDAILRDFDEHSVVITPDGVFSGPAQIRTVYEALLTEFGTIDRGDSPGIAVDAIHVRDDTVFITWHGESRNAVFPFGTDTFICRDGRFARQSIAYSAPQPR